MKYWKAYTLALGFVLLVGAASTIPSQLWFRASGTGALLRKQSEKFGDILALKDYAPCDGVSDDVAGIGSAITALPSTGGVVDARSCSSMIFGSTLTISKAGVKIQFPAATISMGSNQIIVPAGIHGVSLVGPIPYGTSVASISTQTGTRLVYTGTGAAIQVGDLTDTVDTYAFQMEDVSVDISGAGSTAIGLQLNRVIGHILTNPRAGLVNTASTQIGIDLEGLSNYTGGRIDNFWESGGGTGASAIYFGKNANANTISGGHITMAASGQGTAYNFAGSSSARAQGNFILGGDVENCLTSVAYDWAQDNQVRLRSEACTNVATATANSLNNNQFTSGTSTMTITDSGSRNSFSDAVFTQFNRTKWTLNNGTDTSATVVVRAGSVSDQLVELDLYSKDDSAGWRIEKTATNIFDLVNKSTGKVRMEHGASNTFINAEGGGSVVFNGGASSGTGGIIMQNGAASPATVATINSSGDYTTTSTKTKGTCTLNNGTPSTCTATVVSGATCVCTNQTTQANPVKCSTATTTLTVTGPNTVTDVVAYICFG